MSPLRLSGLFKMAAKQTAKGAAITLTSTVASCALACYIEIGAHRLVYHYFPHKYANVEYANGLTQEQLDAVRIYNNNNKEEIITEIETEIESETEPNKDNAILGALSLSSSLSLMKKRNPDEEIIITTNKTKTSEKPKEESSSRFWSDMPKIAERTPILLTAAQEATLPRHEILACAMTG